MTAAPAARTEDGGKSQLSTAAGEGVGLDTTLVDGARRIDRRRLLPGGRAALGGLLVTLAALGVFVTYLETTNTDGTPFVVAADQLRIGAVVTKSDLRVVEGTLPSGTSGNTFRTSDEVIGRAILGPIDAGEVIQFGAVSADRLGDDGAGHEVAVTLSREQLAVGRLDEGDRVDLYLTVDDATAAVARGLRVVQLGTDGGSLTDDREVTVVLAVATADTVGAVVHAVRTGEVTLVRSTFARPSNPLQTTSASTTTETTPAVGQ